MEIKCEAYHCLCALSVFEINDVNADYEDFGGKEDRNPWDAEDYCCGDMRFEGKEATQEILEKYKITLDEYNDICDLLKEKLSFGACCWCS